MARRRCGSRFQEENGASGTGDLGELFRHAALEHFGRIAGRERTYRAAPAIELATSTCRLTVALILESAGRRAGAAAHTPAGGLGANTSPESRPAVGCRRRSRRGGRRFLGFLIASRRNGLLFARRGRRRNLGCSGVVGDDRAGQEQEQRAHQQPSTFRLVHFILLWGSVAGAAAGARRAIGKRACRPRFMPLAFPHRSAVPAGMP